MVKYKEKMQHIDLQLYSEHKEKVIDSFREITLCDYEIQIKTPNSFFTDIYKISHLSDSSSNSTVLSKAALLSCARFTCDIYAKYFLLLLNNIEVQK